VCARARVCVCVCARFSISPSIFNPFYLKIKREAGDESPPPGLSTRSEESAQREAPPPGELQPPGPRIVTLRYLYI